MDVISILSSMPWPQRGDMTCSWSLTKGEKIRISSYICFMPESFLLLAFLVRKKKNQSGKKEGKINSSNTLGPNRN
jgi:hypothetical protein